MTGLCWFPPDVRWLRALIIFLGGKQELCLGCSVIHGFFQD